MPELPELWSILTALDYLGVAVFALTGAMVAARSRQDLVTCLFFAGMTGMGGGTIRDLLIGAPVFWMHDANFVLVCAGAGLFIWFFRIPPAWWPHRSIGWMDAIGLSGYSAFGTLKALSYGIPPLQSLLMGVITATFGGVLRDIVAGRPSVLMQREIYVTAAITGASITVGGIMLGVEAWVAAVLGAGVAMILRGGAILRGWKLTIHPGL